MENFDFISMFITEFFSNSGLYTYSVFVIAAMGLVILYKIVMSFIRSKK